MALGGPKLTSQLDTLIDHHSIGHVDTMYQLKTADKQNGFLNRVKGIEGSVQRRRDERHQLAPVNGRTRQQFVEIFGIHPLHIMVLEKLLLH